jgi:hypothetical protein
MADHPFYPGGMPKMNHVAMSVPADALDEAGRTDLVRYFKDVLGFDELAMLTEDRRRLVFSCVHWEQFIYLIAQQDPMQAPRMDHYGFSVSSREELDAAWQRAVGFRATDSRLDIIDPAVDDQGVVKIHSIYLGYLLPMMIELQYWEFAA